MTIPHRRSPCLCLIIQNDTIVLQLGALISQLLDAVVALSQTSHLKSRTLESIISDWGTPWLCDFSCTMESIGVLWVCAVMIWYRLEFIQLEPQFFFFCLNGPGSGPEVEPRDFSREPRSLHHVPMDKSREWLQGTRVHLDPRGHEGLPPR